MFEGEHTYGNTFSVPKAISEPDSVLSNLDTVSAAAASGSEPPRCYRCQLHGDVSFLAMDHGEAYSEYICNFCGKSKTENPRYRCDTCNYDECPTCSVVPKVRICLNLRNNSKSLGKVKFTSRLEYYEILSEISYNLNLNEHKERLDLSDPPQSIELTQKRWRIEVTECIFSEKAPSSGQSLESSATVGEECASEENLETTEHIQDLSIRFIHELVEKVKSKRATDRHSRQTILLILTVEKIQRPTDNVPLGITLLHVPLQVIVEEFKIDLTLSSVSRDLVDFYEHAPNNQYVYFIPIESIPSELLNNDDEYNKFLKFGMMCYRKYISFCAGLILVSVENENSQSRPGIHLLEKRDGKEFYQPSADQSENITKVSEMFEGSIDDKLELTFFWVYNLGGWEASDYRKDYKKEFDCPPKCGEVIGVAGATAEKKKGNSWRSVKLDFSRANGYTPNYITSRDKERPLTLKASFDLIDASSKVITLLSKSTMSNKWEGLSKNCYGFFVHTVLLGGSKFDNQVVETTKSVYLISFVGIALSASMQFVLSWRLWLALPFHPRDKDHILDPYPPNLLPIWEGNSGNLQFSICRTDPLVQVVCIGLFFFYVLNSVPAQIKNILIVFWSNKFVSEDIDGVTRIHYWRTDSAWTGLRQRFGWGSIWHGLSDFCSGTEKISSSGKMSKSAFGLFPCRSVPAGDIESVVTGNSKANAQLASTNHGGEKTKDELDASTKFSEIRKLLCKNGHIPKDSADQDSEQARWFEEAVKNAEPQEGWGVVLPSDKWFWRWCAYDPARFFHAYKRYARMATNPAVFDVETVHQLVVLSGKFRAKKIKDQDDQAKKVKILAERLASYNESTSKIRRHWNLPKLNDDTSKELENEERDIFKHLCELVGPKQEKKEEANNFYETFRAICHPKDIKIRKTNLMEKRASGQDWNWIRLQEEIDETVAFLQMKLAEINPESFMVADDQKESDSFTEIIPQDHHLFESRNPWSTSRLEAVAEEIESEGTSGQQTQVYWLKDALDGLEQEEKQAASESKLRDTQRSAKSLIRQDYCDDPSIPHEWNRRKIGYYALFETAIAFFVGILPEFAVTLMLLITGVQYILWSGSKVGSDTLGVEEIILSTVAILFIHEIDDCVYDHMFPEIYKTSHERDRFQCQLWTQSDEPSVLIRGTAGSKLTKEIRCSKLYKAWPKFSFWPRPQYKEGGLFCDKLGITKAYYEQMKSDEDDSLEEFAKMFPLLFARKYNYFFRSHAFEMVIWAYGLFAVHPVMLVVMSLAVVGCFRVAHKCASEASDYNLGAFSPNQWPQTCDSFISATTGQCELG